MADSTAGTGAEPLATYLDATTATIEKEPDGSFRDGVVYVATQRLAQAVEDKLRCVPRPDGLHDEADEPTPALHEGCDDWCPFRGLAGHAPLDDAEADW